MDEVEAVARAVAPMMEGGREFDQMPPTRLELRQWSRSGMCSTNDATQDDATELAQAAIAALDAARGKAEPVAWMYERGEERSSGYRKRKNYILRQEDGWIETPLYAHPPAPDAARGDPVARVVEWLRERFPNRHNGIVQRIREDIAAEIERGEPFNG